MFRPNKKSALLPLAVIWLAAHAVLLALILSLKFLTAKLAVLMLVVGAALWFVLRRTRPLLLPPGMV